MPFIRNRRIGDLFEELKLIQGRNAGSPTILRALKNIGSDNYVFVTDEERSSISITISVNKEFLFQKEDKKTTTIAYADNFTSETISPQNLFKKIVLRKKNLSIYTL